MNAATTTIQSPSGVVHILVDELADIKMIHGFNVDAQDRELPMEMQVRGMKQYSKHIIDAAFKWDYTLAEILEIVEIYAFHKKATA